MTIFLLKNILKSYGNLMRCSEVYIDVVIHMIIYTL